MRSPLPFMLALGAFASLVAPASAAPAAIAFGPNDVATVFFVAKSDDKNRVDYAMRLDASCNPTNEDAVFPYWRELEPPPPVRTHLISMFEAPAYGVAEQKLVQKQPAGSVYTVKLRAVPRVITITTGRGADGKCFAVPRTNISGRHAVFGSAFVKLAGPLSVDYVDLRGTKPDGGPVEERLKKN